MADVRYKNMITYIRAAFIIGFVWLVAVNIVSPVIIEVHYKKFVQDMPTAEEYSRSEVEDLLDKHFVDIHGDLPNTTYAGLLMLIAWITEIMYLKRKSNKAVESTPGS